MTDDQLLRIVLTTASIVTIATFRDPILRFLRKIGYRDWRSDEAYTPTSRYSFDEVLVMGIAAIVGAVCLFAIGASVVATILLDDMTYLAGAIAATLVLAPCWIVIVAINKRANRRLKD